MDDIDQSVTGEPKPPPETAVSDPVLVPKSSGVIAGSGTAKPYGFLGLCLSLIGCFVITGLYVALVGIVAIVADGLARGWAHPIDFFNQFEDKLTAGDATAFLHFGLILSLVVYVALFLAILTLARFRSGSAWRELIGWQPWSILRASRSFWFIAGLSLIYALTANFLVDAFYPPSKDWFTVPKEIPAAILLFILATVFAPLTEEIVFRGWIYTSLRASFGVWAALLVSSAAFAAAHYEDSHIYALVVFPIGLGLGALRETTGSLKASISFHAFYNALAYALAAFDAG